jgi:hypothetical protein
MKYQKKNTYKVEALSTETFIGWANLVFLGEAKHVD